MPICVSSLKYQRYVDTKCAGLSEIGQLDEYEENISPCIQCRILNKTPQIESWGKAEQLPSFPLPVNRRGHAGRGVPSAGDKGKAAPISLSQKTLECHLEFKLLAKTVLCLGNGNAGGEDFLDRFSFKIMDTLSTVLCGNWQYSK